MDHSFNARTSSLRKSTLKTNKIYLKNISFDKKNDPTVSLIFVELLMVLDAKWFCLMLDPNNHVFLLTKWKKFIRIRLILIDVRIDFTFSKLSNVAICVKRWNLSRIGRLVAFVRYVIRTRTSLSNCNPPNWNQ